MNTRRLHYPALLLACFCFGYFAVPTHAATPKPPTHGIGTAVIAINGKQHTLKGNSGDVPPLPTAPCTLGQRMNVQIVDGWMFECECVVLSRGFHCSWYLIGQVETVAARKHPKRRVIRYALPKVVG